MSSLETVASIESASPRFTTISAPAFTVAVVVLTVINWSAVF